MLGFSTFSALLPQFTREWSLSGTEAGTINSALFFGYTLAVPLLTSLTDRVDARAIYLVSALGGALAHAGFAMFADGTGTASLFTALYGVSLAGTYMPGLRVLGEHLPDHMMPRATGFYTASFGLGAAMSYVLADQIAAEAGWRTVFGFASAMSVVALCVVFAVARPVTPHAPDRPWLGMLDPRPVFANRSVMAYSLCYALHNYELFTVRSWLVAFLAMSAVQTHASPGAWTPAVIAASMTLLGVFASLIGNEFSIHTGRRRTISIAMSVSAAVTLAVAATGLVSYWWCAVAALAHGFMIMFDSSSITAGAFSAARPQDRGITMAVHSTLGFGGAIVGPLLFGLLVDRGGDTPGLAWSVAYGHMALIVLLGPLIMWRLKPQPAAGDKR